ncbi:hypothetical protein CHS0354_030753 [Potamilus streckersoni]|uniref:Uncharacterized protein n=1 Tax=Potamilus streckersoni TaxID=2493646 RepID=A0AAE0TEM7_9BIVA|nr:hypothetical protein CHS0354_030753 [Potamilus streckersoni]
MWKISGIWQEIDKPHNPYLFAEKSVPQHTDVSLCIQKAKHDGPTAAHTVIRYVEKKSSQETQVAQEHLYVHLKYMPRSSKEKILLKQVGFH